VAIKRGVISVSVSFGAVKEALQTKEHEKERKAKTHKKRRSKNKEK